MIRVKFYEDEDGCLVLSVKGHSGMAEEGKDIICAAASILTYTIAQNVQDAYLNHMLRKKPKISMKKGNSMVTAKPLKEYRTETWHAFFVVQRGFELLAANYPDHVYINTFSSSAQ